MLSIREAIPHQHPYITGVRDTPKGRNCGQPWSTQYYDLFLSPNGVNENVITKAVPRM